MKIKDLQEILQNYDPETEVFIRGQCGSCWVTLKDFTITDEQGKNLSIVPTDPSRED